MVYCWLVRITFNPGKKEEVSPAGHNREHTFAINSQSRDTTQHAQLTTRQPDSLSPLLSTAFTPCCCRQWMALCSAIAAHCRSYEPSCLSYELYQDEHEPDSVMIFERYVTEQDLTVTHRQSAPFLALRQRTEEGQLVKERWSRGYHESNVGFVSRAEAPQ